MVGYTRIFGYGTAVLATEHSRQSLDQLVMLQTKKAAVGKVEVNTGK